MSYVLGPIAVDFKRITAALGSGDKRLISALVKKFGDDFEQFDEMAGEMFDDEGGEGVLTMRAAITQMVMGEGYNEDLGFMYGYALELLCRHFGEALSNRGWSGMRSAWAERADKALKTAGVGEKVLRLSQLMFRGSPVPLPEIDDFPGIGYMTNAEAVTALAVFGEDKLAGVKDVRLREALAEVRGWLVTCADSGRDLICFYA